MILNQENLAMLALLLALLMGFIILMESVTCKELRDKDTNEITKINYFDCISMWFDRKNHL